MTTRHFNHFLSNVIFRVFGAEKDEDIFFSDDSDIGDDFEKKKKSSPPLVMSESEDEIDEVSQVPQTSIKKSTKGKKEVNNNKALTIGKKKVCLFF